MKQLTVGQRYMSLGEPNLGLGIIESIEDKTLVVIFPAAGEKRRYGVKSAPLKRIQFQAGEEVSTRDGLSFIVGAVEENSQGQIEYLANLEGQNIRVNEIDLADSMQFQAPQEKLYTGLSDNFSLFGLRQKAFKKLSWLSSFPYRGFLGGRLGLIDHQYYIADKTLKFPYPRVLLADEVGLGKTIEAGLILHSLVQKGRVDRVLIVTPSSLNYQWFLEMYRKFNLSFSVINENTSAEDRETENAFDENNYVITSLELLTGSEKAREMITSAKWDLLVVDEAHKLFWKPEGPSKQYSAVEELSALVPGLILLTATPEIYGESGHFARLKLLDSDKFSDYEDYLKEQKKYSAYASLGLKVLNNDILGENESNILKDLRLNEQELKQVNFAPLIDRHGPGRMYFRNTRKVIDGEFNYFPERIKHSYQIPGDKEKEKLIWLGDLLEKNIGTKFLLIAKTKERIANIEKYLKNNTVKNKVGLFHEDLSLMARDRQAAFFQDSDGANILLCSEIGSEGRNFQFCQNLILFDLPSTVDLCEQRIGRLDRIGQKSEIHIHIPFLEHSNNHFLYRWYDEVFGVFDHSIPSGLAVQESLGEELGQFLGTDPKCESTFQTLLDRGTDIQKSYLKSLEQGRDILVEFNSFEKEKAAEITGIIKETESSDELRNFLESVYTEFGIDIEDLDDTSQFVKPSDNMFVPSFPALSSEGFSYTYNRQKASEREDLSFMTWDHPLTIGALELICGEEFGNANVAVRKNGKTNPFVELFFLGQGFSPKGIELNRFFPPKVFRVLLNTKGEDFSDKFSFEVLEDKLTQAPKETVQKVANSLSSSKEKLQNLLKIGKENAQKDFEEYKQNSINEIQNFYNTEIERLRYLSKVNTLVDEDEIATLEDFKTEIVGLVSNSKLDLDSLRFIY